MVGDHGKPADLVLFHHVDGGINVGVGVDPRLAERILLEPPPLGYLTVSNALQWRLQYGHVLRLVSDKGITGLQNLLEQA